MQKLLALGLIAVGITVSQGAERLLASPAKAQATAKPDCAWPAHLDAVKAAPNNHKVLLENERVRVLDVTVLPGERENLHAHCLPSVMYLMEEGAYRDYDGQGRLVEEVKEALPDSKFPMTLWLEPQAPHAVHNLDAKPTRLIRIELKK
jgi:mannose-6-phosphate isomerase-like protein (cupin superfamily)